MEEGTPNPKFPVRPKIQQGLEGNISNSDVKITIIDDSDFSRQALAQILQAEGFSIVGSLKSAASSLAQMEVNPCHICLLDVVMPDISGLELAKEMRNRFSDVQIIMMSSIQSETMVIDCIAAGAIDYLQKPFTKEDLLKSIYAAIDNLQKQNFR